MYIKFNGKNKHYSDVRISMFSSQAGGNVVQLEYSGDSCNQDVGFKLYNDDNEIIADYSEFKTVYYEKTGIVQFSDDNTVWEEPKPPVQPEPEPHVFTHTVVVIDGTEYDALDYGYLTFILEDGEYDFDGITEIEADGEMHSDIVFDGTYTEMIDGVEYKRIMFREKTDVERLQEKQEEHEAKIDYIAMMTDIEW